MCIKTNKDIEKLCQLYELYGAITEAKGKQVERIGLDNYPSQKIIIEKVIKLKKKIKETTK